MDMRRRFRCRVVGVAFSIALLSVLHMSFFGSESHRVNQVVLGGSRSVPSASSPSFMSFALLPVSASSLFVSDSGHTMLDGDLRVSSLHIGGVDVQAAITALWPLIQAFNVTSSSVTVARMPVGADLGASIVQLQTQVAALTAVVATQAVLIDALKLPTTAHFKLFQSWLLPSRRKETLWRRFRGRLPTTPTPCPPRFWQGE
jgi:hypothetical protein